ncbi:hypothetical protein DACRYDRAFT_24792 [Dacryopinax primogenitus]|uniref:Uncharacterized protein n=1 Tax=Dacryopinax primogenitus (strain DJM 731) TaxID=1858805 RepID=M5G249_DACPD|nr:uncharacterized protein DACRYDRAFT_24792 [Dacryopinax primogenitus]EJT97837.1 hypothetical protein DACRYDRAFT_24792 [Dacryopinax primogenitus]
MAPGRSSEDLDNEALLPGPSPSTYKKWRVFPTSRFGRIALLVVVTVALTGLTLHAVFRPDYARGVRTVVDWVNSSTPENEGMDGRPNTALPGEATGAPDSSGGGIMNAGGGATDDGYEYGAHAKGHEWTMEELREMVKGTKGYYVRDWSLGLGWNNMRYIIEASLLHAQLLNRTLVLPSFIYARGCEFSYDVCAAYGPQVDRFREVGWRRVKRGETSVERSIGMRDDPDAGRVGWRIPIEYMLDLPHFRSAHPVVLVSEYLTLHGLDPAIEWKSGMWGRGSYQKDNTFALIHNQDYDPPAILRVDKLLPESQTYIGNWTQKGELVQARIQLKKGTSEFGVMEWEDVKNDLRGADGIDVNDDESLVQSLREGGLSVLYTFQGSRGIDLIKHVTEPIRQVAPTTMLRGLVDDWDNITDEVLVLEGEVHLWRKPGSLRFTTPAGRSEFEQIVLHSMQPHPRVREIGELVARHVFELVQGRMWFAGHLRRGDFVQLGWALEHDIGPHLKMLTDAFEKGKETLRQIKENGDAHAAPVPGVQLNTSVWSLELPQQGDPFFLATDERGAEELAYCRAHGALLTPDIISFADRRLYGWELLFSDIVMLVEQVIMSQSAFFYGYGASSVAGGTLNQRAARGMDPRTGVVE